MTRRERASADSDGLRSWKTDLAGAVVAAAIGLAFGALVGWPNGALAVLLALVAFVLGLAAAVAGEYGLNLLLADGREARDELAEATKEVEELRANRVDVEAIRRLQEQQQAAYVAQHNEQGRALKIVEAHNKVLWGVWREQEDSGVQVPGEAVLARLDLAPRRSSESRRLDLAARWRLGATTGHHAILTV